MCIPITSGVDCDPWQLKIFDDYSEFLDNYYATCFNCKEYPYPVHSKNGTGGTFTVGYAKLHGFIPPTNVTTTDPYIAVYRPTIGMTHSYSPQYGEENLTTLAHEYKHAWCRVQAFKLYNVPEACTGEHWLVAGNSSIVNR